MLKPPKQTKVLFKGILSLRERVGVAETGENATTRPSWMVNGGHKRLQWAARADAHVLEEG